MRCMYLDLDQFKLVNDTCGHQAGDRLLKQITGIAANAAFARATRSRVSAATSSAFCCKLAPSERAVKIADNLRQAIRDYRFEWQDGAMNVGASIGIVEINGESEKHRRASMARRRRRVLCGEGFGPQSRAHVSNGLGAGAASRDAVGVAYHARLRRESARAVLPADRADRRDSRDPRGHYELLLADAWRAWRAGAAGAVHSRGGTLQRSCR